MFDFLLTVFMAFVVAVIVSSLLAVVIYKPNNSKPSFICVNNIQYFEDTKTPVLNPLTGYQLCVGAKVQ